MGSVRGAAAVAFVIWLCALAPAAGESQEVDDVTMEQLLFNCRLDFPDTNFAKTFMNEDFISDFTEANKDTELWEKDNVQKAIALLPSDMKHALVDCLGKKNFPSRASGEENNPKKWYSKYLEYLIGLHATSRRRLVDSTAEAPISFSAPSPSPTLASRSAPSPVVDPPSYTAYPTIAPVSYLSGHSAPDSPKQIISPLPDGGGPATSLENAPILPSVNKNNTNKNMIVVIVVTATTSVFFTTLLFYCYNRCCRNKVDMGMSYRDDRPLLTLSSNDFSVGSSQKSFGLSNSICMEKIDRVSLKNELSSSGQVPPLSAHGAQVIFLDNAADLPSSGVVSGLSAASTFSIQPSATAVMSMVTPTASPAPRPPPPPPVMPPSMRMPVPPPPVMAPPMKMSAPLPYSPPLPPPNVKPGLRPPPPPKGAFAPRPPQASSSSGRVPSPLGLKPSAKNHSGQEVEDDAPKTKLKPFFWDKVLANPDQSMVWHQIKSGSFQFNEEMIESLFGYGDKQKTAEKRKSASSEPSPQYVQILDPKKSQNLAILLRALNVTMEEVFDALMEGNELPTELLQTLLKMSPTADEELKLRLYNGEISQLGPAERFLKTLVDIPFAFKRVDTLLFMSSLEEDTSNVKKDLATLEAACQELRSSRLFKKLLEAVIKIGNRMNDGTFRGGAQAFKLDTLLKLADVKGTDGKTTLLHFVVQEIIRSEGMRAEREAKERGRISSLTTISSLNSDDLSDDCLHESVDHYCTLGLKVVSGLTNELENVKNAALLDADVLASMVGNLGKGLMKTKGFLDKDMKSMEEDSGFHHSLKGFIEHAEIDVRSLVVEEERIRLLVKSTTDFFHGNVGKDEGLRLFVIVRDFLGMLNKACEEVRNAPKRALKTPGNRDASKVPSLPRTRQLLFPSVRERQLDSSSSDDGSP